MAEAAKILIDGQWVDGRGSVIEDRSPHDGSIVAVVSRADEGQMREAVAAALRAFHTYKKTPAHVRGAMLCDLSRLISARSEEVARLIAQEVGKPLRTARAEVARAVVTFRLAAEEAPRLYGQTIPMDAAPGSEGRAGFFIRQPIGVIGAITPFNFPLNLVAHKVAPALAVGNTVVLRPTTEAPLTALKLGEWLMEAGFPPGTINVVPSTPAVADALVTSPDVAMISFTGSVPVGKAIRDRVGLKRVTLELGSNSANIITESADLDAAAAAVAAQGFSFAGQSCISAQRIYVQRPVFDKFLTLFIPKVKALKMGDPLEEATDVGPMISESAAQRAEEWVQEARSQGAKVVVGGSRRGSFLEPTVLTDVTEEMKVVCEEVFAPLVAVLPFEDFTHVLEEVNRSKYGLNAAIFTRDIYQAFQAIHELEVGSVVVNDASAYRADHMPYGGVKQSGLGREGVRFAMEEMSEIKFAVFKLE